MKTKKLEIKPETVEKCFAKVGFTAKTVNNEEPVFLNDDDILTGYRDFRYKAITLKISKRSLPADSQIVITSVISHIR